MLIAEYPLASSTVSGLTVLGEIPNMSSISAAFNEYDILEGIREIPISEFDYNLRDLFYSADDFRRTEELVDKIKVSKQISPLIVVLDNEEKPYILEGAHRLGALGLLSVKSLPALVVVDLDD